MVSLYEDNGGGLYLYMAHDDKVYAGLQHVVGSRFADDAAALAAGDTADWTLETYPVTEIRDLPEVAQYADGHVAVIGMPGRSVEKYIGA